MALSYSPLRSQPLPRIVIRIDPDCFVEVTDGLLLLAFLQPSQAAVDVGTGEPGVQTDGFAEVADGLVVHALPTPSHTSVAEGDPRIWVEPDGLVEVADGLVVDTPLPPCPSPVDVGRVVL